MYVAGHILHVGCGSSTCAVSAATRHKVVTSPNAILIADLPRTFQKSNSPPRRTRRTRRRKPSVMALADPRPWDALIGLRDGAHAFVDEALDARAGVGLGGVDVAFRVGRDVVDAEELARLSSAVTEAGQDFER